MIKKEILNDNTDITANSKQLEILKRHFPSCFDKNGAFIPHKMAEIVGDNGLDLSRESYSLNWLGKSYARLLANENPRTLLKENKGHNAKEEHKNSQNLLIKGDNLEVLKHLKNAYGKDGGQVKMIYIDPPYNTGSDGFVYNDDRKFTPEQLSRLAGIELDEAKRILEFTASKSNSHSAWLTFMYPRLYIARELLREDGVIFISIDDNEQAQLKLLCDEIFGEENFIGLFTVNASPSGIDYGHLAKTHDYAYFYAKNIDKTYTNQLREEEKEFKYSDKIGGFNTYPLYNGNVAFNPTTRPNLYYPFYLNPNNQIEEGFYEISLEKHEGWVEVYPVVSKKEGIPRVWRWGKLKASQGLNEEIIGYKTGDGEFRIVQKSRHTTKVIRSLLLDNEVSSRRGTGEVESILEGKVFSFPKPIELIKRFVEVGSDLDACILDFFAGSGTTAHAVMQLNAEDGGNRRFITVQIDEPTDLKSEAYKVGYKSIFDITKTRIEKAAAKIKSEKPNYDGDLGFRIFETLPLFQGSNEEIGELEDELELYDGSKLSNEELGYLLTTWKTYDGIELTEDLQPIEFSGYKGYTYGKNIYFMDKGFSNEALEAFIKALDEEPTFQPSKLVLYGYNFQSKFQRQIVEGLNSYKNKKSIELDVVMRY